MSGVSPGGRRALVAGILILIALIALGVVPRVLRHRELLADVSTRSEGPPVVTVTEARRAAKASEVELPGSVLGLHETQVYARTNGYMKRGLVEIGQRVRSGQLLGELETPEQDQDMAQSRAALAQAEAQLALTRATLDRWEKLVPQGAATKQELDDKRGAFNVAKANADAVHANLHRLEELKRFARVTAPFAGVITARTVDVGALVSSGTTAGARGLFSL
ncbi:MAG: efflux RND transporter periplasmic adaptor subunit, partial [Gemmatimonadota bacterium]|nr:efflux RND transporter periplasmic adaptor subunit [Gemmatimonadota bacterium]